MALTTWDPAHCSAAITLSNGNLTVTCNTSQSATIGRATNGQSTGKYYMECTIGTPELGGNVAIGLVTAATSTSTTTAWLGHDGNPSTSFGNYGGGYYLNNASGVIGFPPMGANATFGFAVDFTHKKTWWWNPTAAGQSGGEWNGDVLANQNPATNTGGTDMTSISGGLTGFGTGTVFFIGCDLENSTNNHTSNFGQTTYAIAGTALGVPTGFLNWDGSGGASTSVVGWSKKLVKLRVRKLILPARFQAKKIVTASLLPIFHGAGLKTKPLRQKKRAFFRPAYRPKDRFPIMYVKGSLVPTVFVGNPPWMYGAGPYGGGPYGAASTWVRVVLQPNVPASSPEKRDKRETYFKGRKLFSQRFFPKHWMPIGQHAHPVYPPIAAGIIRKLARPNIKRLRRWKAVRKIYPGNPFVFDVAKHSPVFWGYGGMPYGSGPYGAAGQLYVIAPPTYPPDGSVFDPTHFWGYGGMPYGSGPYGAAGQVLDYFDTQKHVPPVQGSIVPPAVAIRVAQPYVSVVRSTQPVLASVRKAAPGLQQGRKNTPPLIK